MPASRESWPFHLPALNRDGNPTHAESIRRKPYHIAGKRIHGMGVIPGGMNKALSVADRNSMRAGIDEIVDWSREAVGLVISQIAY